MRTERNELFRLIKSITKSEKGYLKKNSKINTKSGDNKYIKLFDLIEKQKDYDEREIRKSFKGDRFINQLHESKDYLYKSVLKSLKSIPFTEFKCNSN